VNSLYKVLWQSTVKWSTCIDLRE